MANIKISQLPSIGNGLTASTILPVVNTTGTLTTDKVAVGNIANFVLTQAGNTLPPAFVANVSYNVVNAAQPNITSVGTLTRLSINGVGNLTIPGGTNGYVLQTDGAGNLSWTAQTGGGGNGTPGGSNSQLQFNLNGSFAGDPDLTWDAGNNQLNTVNFAASTATIYGNVNAINVNASGNVKPNAIYTDHYYYSNGQAFSGGGNGSPGGSNTQVQFNDGGVFGGNTGFTFNKTTGIFSSPFLAGNGNGLSNIQGANVSGAVTYATTANTVAGGNVVGAVQYATTANSVAVANVVGIGNIATVALSGSTSNVLYGNGVFAAVPSGNPFDQDLNTTDNVQFANVTSTEAIRFSNSGNIVGALGYAPTFVSIEGYGSNSVNITTNDVNTWAFNGDGTLSLPGNVAGSAGNVLIDSADDNFEVRGAQAVNFEANAVVNIYTDTSNNAYQWQFGDDGNLTLPANNSSINYANGTPYGGGGGSGYIIPYEVATFVANTQPGFGEIQFANNEGSNSAPSTAQKLFINASPTNEQSLGTIFQQWTSNSYRGTLSLNNGSDSQATFNISNGRIYFEPELYRGFQTGLNQIWIDDCSINQLIITNATAPVFYNSDFLGEDDVFHATGLSTGNTHVMLNVYGSSQYNPINPNDLWNTFVAFVDNVLYDGSTLRTDTSAIRTQFYNNTGNFRGNIPTQDLYQYFRFTETNGADYFGTAPTTASQGTDATLRIRVNPDNTYTVLGIATAGTGYLAGDNLFVAGTSLGGASPANDLTLLIDSVDGDGAVTAVSFLSGTGTYPWPPNFIDDGSDDQYDTANYINTNLADEISYANGLPQTDSADFGGGDYCVMYYQSFFCMVTTGSSISELFYSGNLGFDGDAALNWTGLRSNQSVIANNNALYAYFDSEYLDGEITPTVGDIYNMVLDSAGINLDGFYAYLDINTGDTFFGSNNDWRVESQNNLYVQSYNDMLIQTLVNQRGIGEAGPALTVRAGSGSPGQREINATAGNGGAVNVNGGSAGGSDGIDSLGNTGGSVNITGGFGSGNAQAGNVNLYGGEGAVAGSINLSTDFGANSSGRVTINTNDGNQHNWAFNANGSTIYPTLTVTRGDRTGTLTGQTILFGDSTQEAILTTSNGTSDINDSQRLVINPGAGYANTTGEGGDIYLYAGRGGDAGGSGGDIKIRGGLGPVDGYGGYIDITGGEADGNGVGGYIDITGGQSANNVGGEIRIQGGQGGTTGGNANLVAGLGVGGVGGNVNIVGGSSGLGAGNCGTVNIWAGVTSPGPWIFDEDGNLTLPTNTSSINYANGSPYGGGGSANTGNVTFDDVTVQGVNQLNLSAGPDFTANLAYLQVRAGDVASHIHFDTGNNEAYDLIVGNDQKFVQVSSTGNIIMSSYDSNTNQYIWTLDTTGNLILAGGNSVIQSVANSSLDPVNPNVSTMIFTPDANYSSQSLVLDPTSPGHIHLRAPGSTIDEPLANIFLGGETSSFEVGVYNGSAPNLFIHSGGNTWTFDNTGVLSVPSNINFNGGGIYQAIDEDFVLRVQDADDDGYGINLEVDEGAGTVLSRYDQTRDQFSLGFPNTSKYYQFNDDGRAVFPGNIHGPYGEGFNIELPGANVNSFITIRTVDNTDTLKANVTVDSTNVSISTANAAYTWNFDNAGNLTFPRDDANSDPILSITGGTNPRILSEDASLAGPANLEITALNTIFTGSSGSAIKIYPDDGEVASDGNLQLWSNSAGNTQYSWTFDTTGNLTVPGNTTVSTANATSGAAGKNISVVAGAADQSGYYTTAGGNLNLTGGLGATDDGGGGGPGGSVNITAGLSADPAGVSGNVVVTVGGSIYTFTELDFNVSTNPPASPAPSLNGFSLVSAPVFTNGNGNVTINSNSNEWVFDSTGNLTTPSNLVIGPSPGSGSSVLQYNDVLQIVGEGANGAIVMGWAANQSAPDSIALIAMNSPFSNGASNVLIAAGNNATTVNYWNFDSTGNLTLPGNTFAVNYANGTQVPVGVTQDITSNGNMSIMTYDGNLKYVNNATVEPSTGNIVSAGNISANVNISANGNISGGTLLATNATGNEGGEIQLAKPPNGTLSGGLTMDAYVNRLRFFEQGGNARGAYIDFTSAPSGVGYNLITRASTIAGANTVVTLDNITASLGGTPTRLFIGAATSNMTMAGTSQTMISGSMAVSSWINVPIVTGTGNGFAMSGAVSSNGDTVVLNITDQGAGSGSWRVTGIIANTSSNLYSVSIERLV